MKKLALALVVALAATTAISRMVAVEPSHEAIVEGLEAPDLIMFPFDDLRRHAMPAIFNDP